MRLYFYMSWCEMLMGPTPYWQAILDGYIKILNPKCCFSYIMMFFEIFVHAWAHCFIRQHTSVFTQDIRWDRRFWSTPCSSCLMRARVHVVKYSAINIRFLLVTFNKRLDWYFNPFQSNFSANCILPSSYLFWVGKKLVDYL